MTLAFLKTLRYLAVLPEWGPKLFMIKEMVTTSNLLINNIIKKEFFDLINFHKFFIDKTIGDICNSFGANHRSILGHISNNHKG